MLTAIHEQTALTGLVAIAVHGITLLGDPWLNPGPAGIAIPFTMAYRPLWTGLGIVAGYLAAILGLSFYIRQRIGPKLWRKAHRATIVVYALAVGHTLGAGTDASTPWLRWWLAITAPIIAVLFAIRVIGARRRAGKPAAAGTPGRRGRLHRTRRRGRLHRSCRHHGPHRPRPGTRPATGASRPVSGASPGGERYVPAGAERHVPAARPSQSQHASGARLHVAPIEGAS